MNKEVVKRAVWTSLSRPAERLWRRRRDEGERREGARRRLGAGDGVVGVVEGVGGRVGAVGGGEGSICGGGGF